MENRLGPIKTKEAWKFRVNNDVHNKVRKVTDEKEIDFSVTTAHE